MSALEIALNHFRGTAPCRPFCTDSPRDGQVKQQREVAFSRRHIQPNTAGLVRWLTFDIDKPNAAYCWQDSLAAAPTLVMINPANGHAHYAYALEIPVPRTQISRIKPLQYLAAIQEGTRRRLGADPGYSGGLIKTPGHPAWITTSFGSLYSLVELAEWCHLPSPAEIRRMAANEDYAGLGRNCTLFEHLRKQSYVDVRRFWRPEGYDAFHEHTVLTADAMNASFTNPLPYGEIKSIARSVSKWIWQRFNPAEFRRIQAYRGALKGKAKKAHLLPQVLRLIDQGKSQREIARALNMNHRTVSNWLKIG